ncbi:MAG: N-formylglutamate deformylase [Proteobacteria bacterium]|nr:N-formylglutamate deformylase [Pseudomonadota bacterium]
MHGAEYPSWLHLREGASPLLLCMPHTGTWLPAAVEDALHSPWLARKDTDWYIDRLYDFAAELDASVVRTAVSRTVIDCNRDPSGVSLYPGQATTALCPTTTFDGEALYVPGREPDAREIESRRREFFEPYHRAIAQQLGRLRMRHRQVLLYDCHSIRSHIPRLFGGELPQFNIGTYEGASCAPQLTAAVEQACAASGLPWVTNGRFKGGYTTRHYGQPAAGAHALQMELACRGYLREPRGAVDSGNWPCGYDEDFAQPLRAVLREVLGGCLRVLWTPAAPG